MPSSSLPSGAGLWSLWFDDMAGVGLLGGLIVALDEDQTVILSTCREDQTVILCTGR